VDLRRDGGTQVRETMNAATVQDYADALAEGVEFPAVTVFFDGEAHWLADGFHRVLAHERAGLVDVLAEVRTGSKEDALIFAAGANRNHGLPMGAGDRRRAVEVLLKTEKWAGKSAREIAAHVGCSPSTVTKIRDEMASTVQIGQLPDRTVGKDGKSRPAKQAKSADHTPAPPIEPTPAPLVNLTSHPAIAAIASAPTRDALDAAYTAANGASLPKDAAEEAGKVYQRRLSEMRESAALVAEFETAIGAMAYAEHERIMDSIIAAQRDGKISHDQWKALDAAWWKKLNSLKGEAVAQDLDLAGEDADLGAIQQGIDEEAARRRSARDQAPATTHEQVDLFTQVATPKPETAAANTAEVITLRAEVESMRAELAGLRRWSDEVASRAGAADEGSVKRAMRLIALAGSDNENEARSAAYQACRVIREKGLLVATTFSPDLAGDTTDLDELRRSNATRWANLWRDLENMGRGVQS
jgi:hypothetical protein